MDAAYNNHVLYYKPYLYCYIVIENKNVYDVPTECILTINIMP